MKKIAILFLLATVLVGFTFGQVWVKGGLDLDNITGANDGDMNPILYTEFGGAASADLGPGSVGVELQAGAGINFASDVYPYVSHGDIYLKGFYALPAGPGTLKFGLSVWSVNSTDIDPTAALAFGTAPMFNIIEIGADYDGVAIGPATLGFGAWYDFKTSGIDAPDMAVFGDDPEQADLIGFRVSAAIDAFSVTYKLKITSGEDTFISTIAYLDAAYQVMDPLKVGLEVDDTGAQMKDGDYFKGFTLKPYAEYALSEGTVAGAFVALKNLNAEEGDMELNIGAWIKHTF